MWSEKRLSRIELALALSGRGVLGRYLPVRKPPVEVPVVELFLK